MSSVKPETIRRLDDVEALTAARSLIVLLDLKLKQAAGSARPTGADASDAKALVEGSSGETQALATALGEAGQPEAAAGARALMLACLQMGYEEETAEAVKSAEAHVLDMGLLSGPVLVAALAAVVAWVPVEKKRKVRESTTTAADGSVQTVKMIDEEIKRAGPAALGALKGWWAHAFGG